MELLGLFVVVFLIYLLIAPIIAWAKAGNALTQAQESLRTVSLQAKIIGQLRAEVDALKLAQAEPPPRQEAATEAPPAARAAQSPAAASADPSTEAVTQAERAPAAVQVSESAPVLEDSPPWEELQTDSVDEALSAAEFSLDLPPPLVEPAAAAASSPVPTTEPSQSPSAVPESIAASASNRATFTLPPEPTAAASEATGTTPEASAQSTRQATTSPRSAAPPRRPPPPRTPSPLQQMFAKGLTAAREWLFGGNLVAKIGLLILFIGVAFLVRFASSYVVVPIEVRLALVAAGAIGLLGWGWRIRGSRPGIALPAQGAALATLMLVTFGAFKNYHLLPAGATFTMLLVLVGFTCLLAVLQNALWLAIFGISGGFAVPILTSTGGGSHVALFSYYALLNAGVLAIALYRSWRVLNLIGFAFTFIIGTAWGVQRYQPEHYLSSQFFLALFMLFYIAIAVIFAWRQAPKLRSYVDGTLVFGMPTVAMGLQYGMVKDFHLGPALSAMAFGLVYALTAAGLWRWRRGSLRLLVESFLALALIFGTLAIPLALDGRWTSAAWALEGAGILWIGLRQRQPLVWRFGLLVQFGSWIAFFKSVTGLDPISALGEHLWLGFGVLGATAVFLALSLRRHVRSGYHEDSGSAARWSQLAGLFMIAAVVWILCGLWVEIWLRVSGEDRASLLVVSAIILVYALQWLGERAGWQLPRMLAGAVTAITGLTFIGLMSRYMNWSNQASGEYQNLAQVLASGSLIGGGLLAAAAWISALGFKQHAQIAQEQGDDPATALRYSQWWLWGTVFWASGFALHGLAHALSWVSGASDPTLPWHAMRFWPTYAVLLAISGWLWRWASGRWQMPGHAHVVLVLWPALTATGVYLFLVHLSSDLPSFNHLLTFNWSAPAPADGALLGFLGGPISGALILGALIWHGLDRVTEARRTPTISEGQRSGSQLVWTIGLTLITAIPLVDCLALFTTHLLVELGATSSAARGWLSFVDARLIWMSLIAVAGIALAQRRPRLAWLAFPAALVQGLASLYWIGHLYVDQHLPRLGSGLAMGVLWLSLMWCLRQLRARQELPQPALQLAHFGRVIAPWLMLPALVSLNLLPLFGNGSGTADGWVIAGIWPDYIAAWLSLTLLVLALRQVRSNGWPLQPLGDWYGRWVIPAAAAWALLLAIYWNLRQDGSMQPLPYLPVLNPLDLTSGFVALLLANLYRLHRSAFGPAQRLWLLRASMALVFAWFNLMLLRTAAQYLGLPYRFDPLYQSQFVQAMLSLVWTLCAFALMRYSIRRLSKPLWMAGAALLAVVVVKLFVIDLKNVGSIARIVSFMGVGGLMLLIGYLAPLPRSPEAEAEATDDDSTAARAEAP
ncbi:MAG: DUF2339 domain-containing protein [Xanthomonadales bacterium]|nr:DUF2339 domain-containing protein [Xanthomonadales bacterium]